MEVLRQGNKTSNPEISSGDTGASGREGIAT